jgi:hypothetical protein
MSLADKHQRILAGESRARPAARPAPARTTSTAARHRAQQPLDDLFEVALRSRRYSSSISSNWRASTSSCADTPIRRCSGARRSTAWCADQHVVVQQHHVHVEQRGKLRRRLVRQVALECREFAGNRIARRAQAFDFIVHLRLVDEVVRHVDATRRDEHCATNGDAARHGQSEHLDAHGQRC